jgi:hypothetical protein
MTWGPTRISTAGRLRYRDAALRMIALVEAASISWKWVEWSFSSYLLAPLRCAAPFGFSYLLLTS